MAGVSFMTRSAEKGMEEALDNHTKRLEQSFGSCFMRLEQQLQFLQRHLMVQQQLIQENHEVLVMQQRKMEEQNSQLRTLLNQQNDLKIRVQTLQADMSVVRYQRFDSSSSTTSRKKDVAEPTKEKQQEPAPPVMEIGTKVRDIGDEDDMISGINDHSMEESGDVRDVQLENINLKSLIQKTAREIEELPVTCLPSFPHRPLSCGSVPTLPDDLILFRGIMLTDEEVRYQRMSDMRASTGRGANKDLNYQPVREPSLASVDGCEATIWPSPKQEGIFGRDNHYGEPEVDTHVNIEVTLMDDGDEECDNEDYEEEAGKEHCNSEDEPKDVLKDEEPQLQPLVNDLFAEAEEQGHFDDEEVTVLTTNVLKRAGSKLLEEKKEVDPRDVPNISKLTVSGKTQERELESMTCSETQVISSPQGAARTGTVDNL
jgi:hypothetical protein